MIVKQCEEVLFKYYSLTDNDELNRKKFQTLSKG